MRHLILGFLCWLSLIAQADVPSPAAIDGQQVDQSICIQQRLDSCIQKCQLDKMTNCEGVCKENIKNECHWAGE